MQMINEDENENRCTHLKSLTEHWSLPARNFTTRWFFDMEFGGCSRFYYGGAGGNRNNFLTKELCDEVCVEPVGRDACLLPKVPLRAYWDRDDILIYYCLRVHRLVRFLFHQGLHFEVLYSDYEDLLMGRQ